MSITLVPTWLQEYEKEQETDEPPSPSGVINQSREYQHRLGLYQCLSSWLWASRSRDRLFCLVSDFGEYRRPSLLETNRKN